MSSEFAQVEWDEQLEADARVLVRLAYDEDLRSQQDWTTQAMRFVSAESPGLRSNDRAAGNRDAANRAAQARLVAREDLTLAGAKLLPLINECFGTNVEATQRRDDGSHLAPGDVAMELTGRSQEILTIERTLLNFLGHLSAIATLTSRFCQATLGTDAKIFDTRKTLPGWRRLQKFAVRQGGGRNHRLGLYDAILIKDNHIAMVAESPVEEGGKEGNPDSPAATALRRAQEFARQCPPEPSREPMAIEIEVDDLVQLRQVLPLNPDIVLLDNMTNEMLRSAVETRDQLAPQVILEASGGVNLNTVAGIAATGIDRISVGALTHSAGNVDLGLDWSAD